MARYTLPISWRQSPRSLTCLQGWVGERKMFSIITYKSKVTLDPRLFGRDGIRMQNEDFGFPSYLSMEAAEKQALERAQARAEEIWREFVEDIALPASLRKRVS